MARKKKKPTARYAFIGLIVAGVAAISAALIGVAKGMIGLQMFTFENTDALNLALQISLALIVLGLAAYALMTPDTVRQFLTGRQARYGSNALIMTVAFLGILIVANVLAYQNPSFLGAPWDLTEDKSNTLAPETLQALATLPGKVHATAFYSTSLDKTSAEELLLMSGATIRHGGSRAYFLPGERGRQVLPATERSCCRWVTRKRSPRMHPRQNSPRPWSG